MKKCKSRLLIAVVTWSLLEMGFIGCSSDSEEIQEALPDITDITLTVGDTLSIAYATSLTVDNWFVAEPIGSSDIAAKHVGETYITVNKTLKVQVTVKPSSNPFGELVLDWGCSRDSVMARQKVGTLREDASADLIVYDLQSEGPGKEMRIVYQFLNDRLIEVGIVVSQTYRDLCVSYLSEHFNSMDVEWLHTLYNGIGTYFVGVDDVTPEKARSAVGMYTETPLVSVARILPISAFSYDKVWWIVL